MSKYRVSKASAAAAIDWHNLKASGEVLETDNAGAVVIRPNVATRIAVGVVDPVASNTVGVAVSAGDACKVILGAAAAQQTIWVQTPADQSSVIYEIDTAADGPVIAAFA